MTITVGNIGAVSWTASSGDIVPVLPSHTEGNLLLGFAHRRSSTAQAPTLTASAGWTKLLEFTAGTMVVWGKKAGASESDPTFTHDNVNSNNPWGAFVMEVAGADVNNLGSIVVTTSTGTQTGAASDHTFGTMTIPTNGVILFDFGGAAASRTVTPTASPAYTEAVDSQTTLGSDASLFVQYRIQTTASNVSAHTAAMSSTTVSNQISFALAPASGSIAPQAMSLRRFMGIS